MLSKDRKNNRDDLCWDKSYYKLVQYNSAKGLIQWEISSQAFIFIREGSTTIPGMEVGLISERRSNPLGW